MKERQLLESENVSTKQTYTMYMILITYILLGSWGSLFTGIGRLLLGIDVVPIADVISDDLANGPEIVTTGELKAVGSIVDLKTENVSF